MNMYDILNKLKAVIGPAEETTQLTESVSSKSKLAEMIETLEKKYAAPDENDKKDAKPRFKNVSCSQCGECFGPGEAGFSHCSNHKGKTPVNEAKGENRELWDRINSKGVVPSIDREHYTDLSHEGLEGPYRAKNGEVLYYDPKEGKYYNRDKDMYVDNVLFESMFDTYSEDGEARLASNSKTTPDEVSGDQLWSVVNYWTNDNKMSSEDEAMVADIGERPSGDVTPEEEQQLRLIAWELFDNGIITSEELDKGYYTNLEEEDGDDDNNWQPLRPGVIKAHSHAFSQGAAWPADDAETDDAETDDLVEYTDEEYNTAMKNFNKRGGKVEKLPPGSAKNPISTASRRVAGVGDVKSGKVSGRNARISPDGKPVVNLAENIKIGKTKMLTESAIKGLFTELQSELNTNPEFNTAVNDGNEQRAEILVRRELNHDMRFNKLSHSTKEQLFDAAMEEYGFSAEDNPFDISSDFATPTSDRPHNGLDRHAADTHELDEIARLAGIETDNVTLVDDALPDDFPPAPPEVEPIIEIDDDFPPAPQEEEPIVLEGDTVDLDGRPVNMRSLTFGDVHSWDAPDYADAYIKYAEFDDGTSLTDAELDRLQFRYGDAMHTALHDSLHEDALSDQLPPLPDEIHVDMDSPGVSRSSKENKLPDDFPPAPPEEDVVVEEKTSTNEDINVRISANGEEDSINLIRKLAGLAANMQQDPVVNATPAIAVMSAEPDMGVELEEEDRDIEYLNTPNEKIAGLAAAIPSGTDLNRSKKQDPHTANRAANPLEEQKLWKQYSAMIKSVTKQA